MLCVSKTHLILDEQHQSASMCMVSFLRTQCSLAPFAVCSMINAHTKTVICSSNPSHIQVKPSTAYVIGFELCLGPSYVLAEGVHHSRSTHPFADCREVERLLFMCSLSVSRLSRVFATFWTHIVYRRQNLLFSISILISTATNV